MSKIGKKNIILPKDTSIKIEGDKITVTGPKGNKSLFIILGAPKWAGAHTSPKLGGALKDFFSERRLKK